jgi:hypothetical protein
MLSAVEPGLAEKFSERTIPQTLLQHKMCDGAGTVLGRKVPGK